MRDNMGFINDAKAAINVQRISKGGKAKLSISQITGLIINLMDAKKNLSTKDYNKVCDQFDEFRKCKTKVEMDRDRYLETAIEIIKEFDKIAPYEKYSGGNEQEFGIFLMKDIRKEEFEKEFEEVDNLTDDEFVDEYKEDIDKLVSNSNGIIYEIEAIKFLRLLEKNPALNKKKLFKDFDSFAQELIKENPARAIMPIGYFLGVLNGTKVITLEEMNEKKKEYQKIVCDALMEAHK